MKRTLICSIPMKEDVDLSIYTSDDRSLPVSDRPVRYPVNAFLEKTLKAEDSVKAVLLVKKDRFGHYEKNAQGFIDELNAVNGGIGAKISYVTVESEFEETKTVHEQLMGQIVDAVDTGTHITADMTYGSKDTAIVLFTALNFAEKFLRCPVDNIVYGQANFENGKPVDTKICDMIPLYCLASVTELVRCDDPEKARKMLKSLLSL